MGVTSQTNAIKLVRDTLGPMWRKNRDEMTELDKWHRGEPDRPTMPRQPTREYRELQKRSVTPWLGLVVTAVAQSLYVEGYRSADIDENIATPWKAWQANGLDARQIAVHRGALSLGLSYVTVLPGDIAPVIRGRSARTTITVYQDPAGDEWPMYALGGEGLGRGQGWRLWLYDDEYRWTLDADSSMSSIKYLDREEHGLGVCPVIRFANMLDLDGRATGEVGPLIPLAGRIDQDTFDRLVVQRFGAWVVRYIAGMAKPGETEEEQRAAKLKLSIEDVLVSTSKDTKFGTLPATPLEGFIKARDADIRDLAAVSQTPPHHLLGEMANLSAEALAAAEAGLTRKVEERRHTFGESWEQVLRLAAAAAGDADAAADTTAEVIWRDTESRSLAQVADALGKIATQLGVPVQALWERIPGVTQNEVNRWRQLAEESDVFAGIMAAIDGTGGSPEPVEPTPTP